jgi:hypothetical protein
MILLIVLLLYVCAKIKYYHFYEKNSIFNSLSGHVMVVL